MARDQKFHFIEGLKSGIFVSASFGVIAAVVVGGIASFVLGAPAVAVTAVSMLLGGALGACGAWVGAETSTTGNSKVAIRSGLATAVLLSACVYAGGNYLGQSNERGISPSKPSLTQTFKKAQAQPAPSVRLANKTKPDAPRL